MASDLRDLAEIRSRLYALPPDEFTRARNEAAKQAHGALARTIREFRRPTLSAWLVNLLAAHRSDALRELLNLAEQLRDAQRDLNGAELRELSTRRQALISSLSAEARDLAAEHGRPVRDGTIWEVENTLRAAVADPEVAEQVRAGTLTRPAEYSGLGIPSLDAASQVSSKPVTESRTSEKGGSRSKSATEETDTGGAEADEETTPSGKRGRARLRVIMGGRAESPRIPVEDEPSKMERARKDRIEKATAALADAERELEEASSAEADATRRLGEIAAAFDELRVRERQLRSEQTHVDRDRRRASRRRQGAEKAIADARRRLR